MELINDYNIFYKGYPSEFEITTALKAAIQQSVNCYEEQCYNTVLKWNYVDNELIFKQNCLEGISEEIFWNNVAILKMVKLNDIDPKYIEENNIKDYHIKLINRLYIDYDYYEEYQIQTANKRPFGNKWVESDIMEEITGIRMDEIDYDYCHNIYNEVLKLAAYIFKEIPIKYLSFIYAGAGEFFRFKQNMNLSEIQLEYLTRDNWSIKI